MSADEEKIRTLHLAVNPQKQNTYGVNDRNNYHINYQTAEKYFVDTCEEAIASIDKLLEQYAKEKNIK